jgi:hypothetical protein
MNAETFGKKAFIVFMLVCTVVLLLDFTKSIPPSQNQCCKIAESKKTNVSLCYQLL